MGHVQDTPVSTSMISNVCMICHMKVHIVSYNLDPKNLSKSKIHTFLLSICTGILGTFDILQFEISSLMNWIFFLVWKQTGYFYQFKLYFFPSFWARVKYFDVPCSTIYSLSTIYRDKHYQLLVWWIHYTHCCESKKLKPGKFYLCSLWNNIFNYPNWDFGFC